MKYRTYNIDGLMNVTVGSNQMLHFYRWKLEKHTIITLRMLVPQNLNNEWRNMYQVKKFIVNSMMKELE